MDLELLASGYGTVEGPALAPDGNLYFSDVTGGGVRRLTPDGDIELVIPKRKGVAGIVVHADGGIVVAGRDLSHFRNGENRVLLGGADCAANDLDHVTGFADISANEDGMILAGTVRMADPDQKIITEISDGRNSIERLPSSMILVTGLGRAKTLYGEMDGGTNGIAVDGKTGQFYQAHTRAREVIRAQRTGPESYRIADRFSTAGISAVGTPDGMVLDEEGCLWLALHKGGCIARLGADGQLLQRTEMPARNVSSLCFGGPDGTDLYITTGDNTQDPALGGCIFRTRVKVRGAPVPMAAI